MHKFLNIFICIALLGLFLTPSELSACSKHTSSTRDVTKDVCEHGLDDQNNTKQDSKDCCNKTASDQHNCAGQCGDKSCHSPNSTSLYLQQTFKDDQNTLYFIEKNTYPSYNQPHYSAGVISIWQPPKIG